MFKTGTNKEIGAFLKKRIDNKFKSHRQFCKKYLELEGIEPSDEETRKLANRISQILQGKKGIQITDLPIISHLLGLSCEQILSCSSVPTLTSDTLTNKTVANSKKKADWDKYISNPDSPILNSDEYGKTIIDYALEYENYGLIRHLVDNGYIWFVDEEHPDQWCYRFGAGTKIKKRPVERIDLDFTYRLMNDDLLRTSVIALAIRNGDVEMLEKLHAREIPELYNLSFLGKELQNIEQFYNPDLINAIVASSDVQVIKYFSDEFVITDWQHRDNTYIFPYIDKVIEASIRNRSSALEYILQQCIAHNNKVLDDLRVLLNGSENTLYPQGTTHLQLTHDGSIVSFFYEGVDDQNRAVLYGMVSNIIRVDRDSNDPMVSSMIKELNGLYKSIVELKEKK